MSELYNTPDGTKEPRTTREIIDGMPTPTDAAGTFALFAALELEAMEQGRSTPVESAQVLRDVFGPRPEDD